MKSIYVSDEVMTIDICGLKVVAVSDRKSYLNDDMYYYLELEYENISKEIQYPDKKLRDEMYKRIAVSLVWDTDLDLHKEERPCPGAHMWATDEDAPSTECCQKCGQTRKRT